MNVLTLHSFTRLFGNQLQLQTIVQNLPVWRSCSVLPSAFSPLNEWSTTGRHPLYWWCIGRKKVIKFELMINGEKFEYRRLWRSLHDRLLNKLNENGKQLPTTGSCKGPFTGSLFYGEISYTYMCIGACLSYICWPSNANFFSKNHCKGFGSVLLLKDLYSKTKIIQQIKVMQII